MLPGSGAGRWESERSWNGRKILVSPRGRISWWRRTSGERGLAWSCTEEARFGERHGSTKVPN
jgi:hypothetical protein